mmetsp:Transcript_5603/g.22130  ORF Transcript_5603/g.22130 Transcript_5603/m.22130 type:complete len:245 (-) Transcript_5603:1203-1937(-)
MRVLFMSTVKIKIKMGPGAGCGSRVRDGASFGIGAARIARRSARTRRAPFGFRWALAGMGAGSAGENGSKKCAAGAARGRERTAIAVQEGRVCERTKASQLASNGGRPQSILAGSSPALRRFRKLPVGSTAAHCLYASMLPLVSPMSFLSSAMVSSASARKSFEGSSGAAASSKARIASRADSAMASTSTASKSSSSALAERAVSVLSNAASVSSFLLSPHASPACTSERCICSSAYSRSERSP